MADQKKNEKSSEGARAGASKLAITIAFIAAAFAAWIFITLNLAG